MMRDEYTCPNGCDLRGEPIPKSSQELYGGATHYSRIIGLDAGLSLYDGVIAWHCPDCGLTWTRELFEDDPYVRRYVENANGLVHDPAEAR